jgi:hypothetical protein
LAPAQSGAAVGKSLGPDPPAVALDDALHIGEADSGPLELLHPVQPMKHAEQLAHVGHVETDAVVLDENDALVALPKIASTPAATSS